MTGGMKLHGQRWLYRIGNAEVVVDNAFSWWGWGQERWLINNEIIGQTKGWFVLKRSFAEPWLTYLGDSILAADLRARPVSVECRVTLDGELLDPDAIFKASWFGRGAWPTADNWIEVKALSFVQADKER